MHEDAINFEFYEQELGVPRDNMELKEGIPHDIDCRAHVCKVCGWWVLEKSAKLYAKKWQVWDLVMISAGRLKSLDLRDISLPLMEVRSYLAAKYESRFTVHPRLFEETVASVFRDLGYISSVTAYSGDGGIDVVLLDSNGCSIGVQVKRHKNRIGVEQIRSFLGALTLGNCVKGLFITTSGFEKGAYKTVNQCHKEFIPIDLLDASRFFELLKIAQLKNEREWGEYPLIFVRPPPLYVFTDMHLNSL